MAEIIDIKTRKPMVEQPKVEKEPRALYREALEKKRDTLLAFHAMNSFRKGKDPKTMSSEEVEQYDVLKQAWQSKKENSLAVWDSLPEDQQDDLASMGSRLLDVQVKLTLLGQYKSEVEESISKASSNTETPVEDLAGEARIHPEEPVSPEIVNPVDNVSEAERVERQEAEANPDRPAPKGFLQRVREAFTNKNAIAGNNETVESRMSPLGLRHEAIRSVFPESESGQPAQPESARPETTQSESTPQQVEVEPRKASAWGWLKERGKGMLTLGLWDFHQAEMFGSKTKEVAIETKALATLIQQERNLSLEEAQTEAQEMMGELHRNGLDGVGTAEFYEANSDIISERKRKENDEEVDYIIKSAGNELVNRLAKYRGEAGQDVLTQENKLAFEADLRGELNKMRDGAMRKDFINFAKVMRRNLDENWQWRYVWGAIEAAAGLLLVKYISGKLLAGKGTAILGKAGAKEAAEVGLKDTIWGEAKRQLISHGVANPTNVQIQEVATIMAKDSGVKVISEATGHVIWDQTAGGIFKDIALQKGFLIKLGGGIKHILAMKAGGL